MPHMQEAREAFESNRVWASVGRSVKHQYAAQRCRTMRTVCSQPFGYDASKLAELWAFCSKTREAASVLLALARFFAVHDLRLPWLWAAQKR